MILTESNQERRDAAIKRSRRIDRLPEAQYLSALHRIAAIEPVVMDRVLGELEAFHRRLHPVRFVTNASNLKPALLAICEPCQWRTILEDGHDLPHLQRLVAEHSGIEWP
jgi:hypothetical protein